MLAFSSDKITNIVHQQIKRAIHLCLDNQCYGAAAILTYAGIDAMALVSAPAGQDFVKREDFVRWSQRYIPLVIQGHVAGIELYSARCAMLHAYGADSKLTKRKASRQIGYSDHSIPEVMFNPTVSNDLVLVSVKALADGFLRGVDQFLIDQFSDPNRAPIAEKRLEKLCMVYPL